MNPSNSQQTASISPELSSKTAQFTESVIREMTRLAIQYKVVNLSQGFPDFPAPIEIKRAAQEAIAADINQYAITWGSKNLRNAIAEKFSRTNGLSIDPEREITVCCGSTEAMMSAMMAIINPGDEVVVFEPFYENYGPDAILSGAQPRFVKLHPPDWKFDPQELAAVFGPKTKAIILNTPNNPTGKAFERAELEQIRTNALSKTYSVTGWRVGWAIAPAEATSSIRKVHDFLTVGAAAPLQEAGAAALHFPQDYYNALALEYTERRDRLLGILSLAGFRCFKPRGAYYIMTDISTFGFPDDVAFAKYLVKEIGVAAVPGSSFYRNSADGRTHLRFTFCKTEKMFQAAAERLARLTAGPKSLVK